jgi:hypothetical protein
MVGGELDERRGDPSHPALVQFSRFYFPICAFITPMSKLPKPVV